MNTYSTIIDQIASNSALTDQTVPNVSLEKTDIVATSYGTQTYNEAGYTYNQTGAVYGGVVFSGGGGGNSPNNREILDL